MARDRHGQYLRLLSSSGRGLKRALHAEDDEGQQQPLLPVFQREPDGTPRFTGASEQLFAPSEPGQDPRATGTIEPSWYLFDFGPRGRPRTFNKSCRTDAAAEPQNQ